MKQPVIFGVSYASDIASGVVQADENNSVLKINTGRCFSWSGIWCGNITGKSKGTESQAQKSSGLSV